MTGLPKGWLAHGADEYPKLSTWLVLDYSVKTCRHIQAHTKLHAFVSVLVPDNLKKLTRHFIFLLINLFRL